MVRTLPLWGAQVQSLVGELGSHMLCGAAKKKKKSRHPYPHFTDENTEAELVKLPSVTS